MLGTEKEPLRTAAAKLEGSNPLGGTKQAATLNFDHVMEQAERFGMLSVSEYDRLTDEVARGDRTELDIAADWSAKLTGFWVVRAQLLAAKPRTLSDLSIDELAHVLLYLPFAFDIANAARVSRVFSAAAKLAGDQLHAGRLQRAAPAAGRGRQ